jgi:hypothetical protein
MMPTQSSARSAQGLEPFHAALVDVIFIFESKTRLESSTSPSVIGSSFSEGELIPGANQSQGPWARASKPQGFKGHNKNRAVGNH